MQIVWGEQAVRWFRNASEYTGYNKKLAKMLLKHIPFRDTLCDAGCGAGLIDMELAPYIRSITCADISGEAADSVLRTARELGIGNIDAVCADAPKIQGRWDTVLGLFYGGVDFFEKHFHQAKDRLILVTHGTHAESMGPENHRVHKCFDVAGVRERLESRGVRYYLEEGTLEYGQPLTDMDEARAFVRAYSTPMTDEELEAHLEKKLIRTGEEKYPYYLPHRKDFGIFVVRRDENEKI